MGKHAPSPVVGYKNYAGAVLVLAQLVHKLKSIKIGDFDAWVGNVSAEGSISIDKPKLYGTGGAEGGFVGTIDFQPGLPTQMPDDYLLSVLGSNISANRGVSQLVFRQAYWGNNPYLKSVEALGERIHLLADGSEQWYDEKAAIPGSLENTVTVVNPDYHVSALNGSTTPNGSNGFTVETGVNSALVLEIVSGMTYGGYSLFPADDNSFVPPEGAWTCRVCVQNNDTLAQTFAFEGNYVNAATALSAAIAAGPQTFMGASSWTVFIWDTDASNNRAGMSVKVSLQNGIDDINPAHLLRECLTNKEWGYGYDVEDIDDAAFRAAADQLYTEALGVGYLWDDESTTLDDIINKTTAIIDGNLYVDRDTLLWTLTLVRNDYNPDDLTELRIDYEITSISNYARAEFLELVNSVTVQYYNSANNGNGTLTVSNPALFLQQGVKTNVTRNYDMCGNAQLASLLGQRELNVVSQPLASCQVTATSAAKHLKRGSVFKLTSPRHNFNQSIVRVTSIVRGDNTTKQIKLTVVEDRFAMPQTVFVITPPPPPNTSVAPAVLPNRALIEVPYALLLSRESQATIDAALAADTAVGFFGVAAARVTGQLNAEIYADAGAGFEDAARLDFCPYGELSADIDYLDTSLSLVNSSDLSELVNGTVFLIDSEFCSFVANTNGDLTEVRRGIYDSVPAKHLAGAKVFFVTNYLDGPATQYANSESVDVKLLTNAPGGMLSLSLAPSDTIVFASRAIKPYPPGNLKINALDYPATATGSFSVAWASRNRQSQADVIVPTTQGDVTPEATTRYGLRFLRTDTDAVLVERADIASSPATVVLNYTGNVELQLYSITDNGESYFRHSHSFDYTPPGGTVVSTITATTYDSTPDIYILDGGGA